MREDVKLDVVRGEMTVNFGSNRDQVTRQLTSLAEQSLQPLLSLTLNDNPHFTDNWTWYPYRITTLATDMTNTLKREAFWEAGRQNQLRW
jgi:hypothetical protein